MLLAMEASIPVEKKRKKKRQTDYSRCLICQKEDSEKDKLFSLTKAGYPVFAFAIENRQDEPLIHLRSKVIPMLDFLALQPVCHKQCRSMYTNKRAIEQHTKKKKNKEK